MKKLCCLILSLGLFSSCAFFNQVLKESGNKTLESLGEAGDAILRADEEITPSQEWDEPLPPIFYRSMHWSEMPRWKNT